jgi:hypothetical protein
MIRTALDSDSLSAFGIQVDFALTYSDLVTDPAAFEAEHPRKQVVYIDRGNGDPGNKASIIDVETGAHRIADIAPWYDHKTAAHVAYLTFYVNRSNMLAAEAAVGGRHMFRWVATLDGTIVIPGFTPLVGPDLVQIAGASATGIHADFSLVLNPGWHPSPQPAHLAQMGLIAGNAARDLAATTAQMSSLSAMIKALT